ncbi:hypothetical protein EDB81DRAFT_874330 [Dactylonectria macrodidyma]|uniref:Uncharacterized protein n=1 Tax=Dactylonectria macrodidyma TaxID=307937 RepID=A0A9P9FS73_9HYPO|nr:hypothetical protein EDB81DRAFT_874330 [Dactylonectria macrodidyma]
MEHNEPIHIHFAIDDMLRFSQLYPVHNTAHTASYNELFGLNRRNSATMVLFSTSTDANEFVTYASNESNGFPLPTTLETVTRSSEEWASGKPMYPVPTDQKTPEDRLPDNPNFPWGGDSPIHRHQNTTELGDGTRDSDLLPRSQWRRRWEDAMMRLQAIWQQPQQQQRPKADGEEA